MSQFELPKAETELFVNENMQPDGIMSPGIAIDITPAADTSSLYDFDPTFLIPATGF